MKEVVRIVAVTDDGDLIAEDAGGRTVLLVKPIVTYDSGRCPGGGELHIVIDNFVLYENPWHLVRRAWEGARKFINSCYAGSGFGIDGEPPLTVIDHAEASRTMDRGRKP